MGALLALDLRDLLATGQSETVTAGRLAAVPDRQIGVIESGGLPSSHTMAATAGSAQLEWPTVQILSRAPSYAAAAQIAQNAHHLLDGYRGGTLASGTRLEWITALQQPFFLEDDPNGRVIFACNYLMAKQRHTSTST